MSKQYFFQSGSFSDLSYAELVSVFEAYNLKRDIIHIFSDDILLIKSKDISEDLLLKIFNRLGGFIRFGVVIDNLDTFLEEYLKGDSRIVFGISIIGENKKDDFKFIKKLGREMKDGFKEVGIPSRFVFSNGKRTDLNSAQVTKNSILEKGFELNILRGEKEEIYARTIAIQDVDGFAKRDSERPHTDIDMGVLPPKLARLMVNLTALSEGTIWDPFCGSGTILMESAVLGFNFLGSDIDEQAISNTDKNVRWLADEGYIGDILYDVFQMDVTKPETEILKKLRNTSISAIVCEPYMGPPQKKEVSNFRADELIEDVKELYRNLFYVLDEKLKVRNIRMVLIVPSYKTKDGWKTFGIGDVTSNRWKILNSEYSLGRGLKWSRKNSIITRNIYILQRT